MKEKATKPAKQTKAAVQVKDIKPKKDAKAGYKVKFEDIVISSYQTGGSSGDVGKKSLRSSS